MEQGKDGNTNMLSIRDLIVRYETTDGIVEAVNKVSFDIAKGETLGLVGETGAGKTTIALSVMKLLDIPPGRIVSGSIQLHGQEILDISERQMKKIRGKEVSMIFQDPMTSLNPMVTVGKQIMEVVQLHEKCSKTEALKKAMDMLETVGIPGNRVDDYPHQFSGGMKQRVVIAIALACNPQLLIADEPTTALDVTIQAQVLELMRDLKEKYQTSLLMITHDFGIVAEICDKCAVIYAGEIVEIGNVHQIFHNTAHPYTKGLFDSLPDIDSDEERLKPIPGMMCDPMDLPVYCSFYDRCAFRTEECKNCSPELKEVEPGHLVRCLHCLYGEGNV